MKIYNHDETLSTEFEMFIPEYEVGREECYIRTCFYALKSLLWMWRHPMFPHSVRTLPRIFYGMVHSYKSAGIPTGLTSDLYAHNDDMTDDHKNSPQTVGEFVLDKANLFLNDYELFVDEKRWRISKMILRQNHEPKKIVGKFFYARKAGKWVVEETLSIFKVNSQKYIKKTKYKYRSLHSFWMVSKIKQTVMQEGNMILSYKFNLNDYKLSSRR